MEIYTYTAIWCMIVILIRHCCYIFEVSTEQSNPINDNLLDLQCRRLLALHSEEVIDNNTAVLLYFDMCAR